ncbi:hypothetical protein SAMN05216410_2663 [Sanguibacter gelidistatuariae]|uniref:Uncharacterized protein n=1 Tax=Sanguibacter gelidistatuariae TaxID=1814289 RepID=A0A1G6RE89_9MICO|nr:Rv2175c family DNA-binding protein [Sanguibacter gelidistatuariae]SDD02713.1 hypothetical protein SAMN05216410_2663 [Sanguibacter gelidistatuariae]
MTNPEQQPQPDPAEALQTARIDALVGDWVNVPGVAERLGTKVTSIRSALSDRRIVGMKRGERNIFSVPEQFLIPAHLSNPADRKPVQVPEGETEQIIILPALKGTIIQLGDVGYSDPEIIEWLFTVEGALGQTPMEALRTGRKSAVRRAAQGLG